MSFIRGYEFDEMSQRPLYREVTRKLVDMCPVPAGGTVVDVGCGSGLATGTLLEHYQNVGSVIGIDPSEHELRIAEMRVRDPRVRFLQGRAQELESRVGSVDATILSNVVHQIPAPEREPVVSACFRMLRNGGICALNTLFYKGAIPPETGIFYSRWMFETNAWLKTRGREVVLAQSKPTALEMFTPQEHEDMLRRAGFLRVSVEEVTYSWSIEDWSALSAYSVFVEGATGLTDVALGSEALKVGLRKTFASQSLDSVPRRWLFASGARVSTHAT